MNTIVLLTVIDPVSKPNRSKGVRHIQVTLPTEDVNEDYLVNLAWENGQSLIRFEIIQ